MKTLIVLAVLVVIAALIPWRDWILALRIRQARKSLAGGRETLATLQAGIADLKAKIGTEEKYFCLDPLIKSLEAQERSLSAAIERFVVRLKTVEELRKVVNSKSPEPADVDATLTKLHEFNNDPKLDEFLKSLNGDK